MSLFPPAFDTRSDLVIALMLAKVTTVDGAHGFIIGADGRFVDVDGGIWWGSQLLSSSDLEFSIGGVAIATTAAGGASGSGAAIAGFVVAAIEVRRTISSS